MANDYLVDLIHGLSDRVMCPLRAELKKYTDNNRALQLLDLILTKNEWDKNELSVILYHEPAAKGYYRCRNKLKETIESVLFAIEHGLPSEKDKALQLFGIGRQLLKENLWSQANDYLNEAEKHATEQKNYLLVRQIHAELQFYAKPLKISRTDLSKRMDANRRLDNLHSKISLVREQLEAEVDEARRNGKTFDRKGFFSKLLKDFRITKKMMRDPWLAFNLCDIYRSVIKSNKAYGEFEIYTKGVHWDLKEAGSYTESNWQQHFSIVFFIAHACYRNLKFDDTAFYVEEALKITSLEKLKTHPLYFKCVALSAGEASFTGKVEQAIEILENLLHDENALISDIDRLDFELNLSVYYFQNKQFDKANACIRRHEYSKTWLRDNKGHEWVFRKELIEVLIQYEMGNKDVAHDWLNAMQRNNKEFFDHELYQYANEFLAMVIYIIDLPAEMTSDEFRSRIRALSDNWPVDRQDLLAISFLCWIKSKNRRREYYDVLMEWMEREKEKMVA